MIGGGGPFLSELRMGEGNGVLGTVLLTTPALISFCVSSRRSMRFVKSAIHAMFLMLGGGREEGILGACDVLGDLLDGNRFSVAQGNWAQVLGRALDDTRAGILPGASEAPAP